MADVSKERETDAGPESPSRQPWAATADEVLREFGVDPDQGLARSDIGALIERHGENRLAEQRKRSAWDVLKDQVANLIIGLLAVAASLSFFLGHWLEGTAILIALAINVLIGFVTELRATRSIEALQKMAGAKARVLRDGRMSEVPAENLVPGDILVLESGDVVAADVRLVEANRMQADESALTGESMPVAKSVEPVAADALLAERTDMLYRGTALTVGSGRGVVTATGLSTELGRISELAEAAKGEETPLEKRLAALGQRMIWVVLFVAAMVLVNGWLAGMDIFLLITTAIALAVAAIPEGLPIVATVALARGMWRMNARNALINRLSAVETLGSTSVVLTDKTGTLTENRMRLERMVLLDRGEVAEVTLSDGNFFVDGRRLEPRSVPALWGMLEVGVLCNNAQLDARTRHGANPEGSGEVGVGDPLELALLQAGQHAGLSRSRLLGDKREVREDAFDPQRALMATWHREDNGFLVAVKGAPESVLDASVRVLGPQGEEELGESHRQQWSEMNAKLASQGLRVLGAAFKRTGSEQGDSYDGLTLLGLYGLMDPPRQGVGQAIASLHHAGIKVVMVTGDQLLTATNIAQTLGLGGGRPVEGRELHAPDELSEEARRDLLQTTIFSRVTPEQKLDLIALHQSTGAVVAMTGDGVNDAPALKKASIGIAMGIKGTDAAKESSDMVLVDDNFASIVAGVEEGRREYDNIARFTRYLLSSNVGELVAIVGALLLGLPLILIPVQILWINLVTDGLTALALGLEPAERDVMQRRPRDPQEAILTRNAYLVILILGIWLGLLTIYVFLGLYEVDLDRARTMAFTGLIVFELYNVLNFRSFRFPLHRIGFFSNPALLLAILGSLALQALVVYVPVFNVFLGTAPLTLADWGLLALLGLPVLLAGEAYKILRLKRAGASPGAG